MKQKIQNNKFVELNYKVIDEKTGQVLSTVEFPLSYVHGADQVLAAQVTAELEGRAEGDVIEISIDGNLIYGARDEDLSTWVAALQGAGIEVRPLAAD